MRSFSILLLAVTLPLIMASAAPRFPLFSPDPDPSPSPALDPGLLPLLMATPFAPPTPDKDGHVIFQADPDRTIAFSGEVNNASADEFIVDLNSLDEESSTKPIYIVINSIGGSLDAGFRIENNLDAVTAPTVCIVETGAYSMASGILLHCKYRYMEPHSSLMFHFGSVSVSGSRYEAERAFRHVMDMFDQLDSDNAAHLHMTLAKYRQWIDHDRWLTETQALKAGIVNGIVDKFKTPVTDPLQKK